MRRREDSHRRKLSFRAPGHATLPAEPEKLIDAGQVDKGEELPAPLNLHEPRLRKEVN